MQNNYESQYLNLVNEIIETGVAKSDRTGTGTKSLFGKTLRHKMSDGFPLLTTRKISLKNIFTELKWFLSGNTNIKYLIENDCHIWDGDCYSNYIKSFPKYVEQLPKNSEIEFIINKEKFIEKIKNDEEFANKWGNLGPIYGENWRKWKGKVTGLVDANFIYRGTQVEEIDQISNLLQELKTNPDSRRMRVTAWNPVTMNEAVLPACHTDFQVYTREMSIEERYDIHKAYISDENSYLMFEIVTMENMDILGVPRRKISLMFNMRSNDIILGQPYNMASYSLLLMMLAKQVNMVSDEVICNIGDAHIYKDQVDIFLTEQKNREQKYFPVLNLSNRKVEDASEYEWSDLGLFGYDPHKVIKYPLSN